jgi:hypothetical protein
VPQAATNSVRPAAAAAAASSSVVDTAAAAAGAPPGSDDARSHLPDLTDDELSDLLSAADAMPQSQDSASRTTAFVPHPSQEGAPPADAVELSLRKRVSLPVTYAATPTTQLQPETQQRPRATQSAVAAQRHHASLAAGSVLSATVPWHGSPGDGRTSGASDALRISHDFNAAVARAQSQMLTASSPERVPPTSSSAAASPASALATPGVPTWAMSCGTPLHTQQQQQQQQQAQYSVPAAAAAAAVRARKRAIL